MILDGIRVLDFTQYLAGAGATCLIAGMGADVIKLEQSPGGDPGRALSPVRDGRGGFFVRQIRGKKSLCLGHPYYRERAMVCEGRDPVLGPIEILGFPFKFSASPELSDFEVRGVLHSPVR